MANQSISCSHPDPCICNKAPLVFDLQSFLSLQAFRQSLMNTATGWIEGQDISGNGGTLKETNLGIIGVGQQGPVDVVVDGDGSKAE